MEYCIVRREYVPVPPENVIRALITCTYGFPYCMSRF